MSDFLHTLTLEDKIVKLPWCETYDGKPTQTSMVIYVIEGPSKLNSFQEFDSHVITIAKEYRKLYQKLNKYLHYRGDPKEKTQVLQQKLDF